MPIDLNTEPSPINPDDPKFAMMLANLQGNILKSHGRDFTHNLFIRFTGKPQEVKQWLADFTNRFITSALRQLDETKEFKLNGISGRALVTIHLSAAGYRKLGFDPTVFDEQTAGGANTLFRDGMESALGVLNDPLPKSWDEGYRGRKIHAMILIADENEARLKDVRKIVEASIRGIADVVAREDGRALREENSPIEHFGYHDGVSQPLYFQSDITPPIDQWDPSAPLNILLLKDPLTGKADCFGSYFVFRKLEQNVKGFKEREETLAAALGLPSEEDDAGRHERGGAMVVGRFENGVPVLLSDTEDDDAKIDFNNFNYQTDKTGGKCPFQGHIRKTNPRGDTDFSAGKVGESERRRRITRRGITYGKRKFGPDGKPSDQPSKGVGLLFQCFQRSIPNQFGFMQAMWANNPGFRNSGTGIDPVIGQHDAGTVIPQKWFKKWGASPTETPIDFDFRDFVTMKGGEFFFAPSIPFLRDLGSVLPAIAKDRAEIKKKGIK